MFLESLGADSFVFGAFQTYAADGLVLGRIGAASRNQYRLYTETGERAAEPSGALWYRAADRASMPVTGDWVAASVTGPEQATVEAVLPRRTCFSRRAAGGRNEEQPLAANMDLVFLVCGLDGDYNLRRLERYLTLAAESGALAVVVLNKADVCPDAAARAMETRAVAGAAPVVVVSALEGSIDALTDHLVPGRTVALLGSSGAGKSTIVNRLLDEKEGRPGGPPHWRLRTGEVRESDSRGRHTTTRRELIPLAGRGVLIDTPGLREIQLWAGTGSVDRAFDEIGALATACRYRDCGHSGEDGCAVAAALEAGELAPERWESYRKLRAEARRHEALTDPLAAQEQKRWLKRVHKRQRDYYKFRR
jgi:ribosome biogenesis GTPase